MWGIVRGGKRAESVKPHTEISIEHLQALYKTRAFRARNDQKQKGRENMKIKKNVDTFRKIIKEYNCDSFIIGVPVRQANYLSIVRISKDMLIRYADKYLEVARGARGYVCNGTGRVSITDDEGEISRKGNAYGKPCIRFKLDALRQDAPLLEIARVEIPGNSVQSGFVREYKRLRSWSNYEPEARRIAYARYGYMNAGLWLEGQLSDQLKMVDIGENDRQSHCHHTDLRDVLGQQHEVKLASGWLSSQFFRVGDTWEN